jgi:hypothetical protein
VKSTKYGNPHYEIFSSLLFRFPFWVRHEFVFNGMKFVGWCLRAKAGAYFISQEKDVRTNGQAQAVRY